MTQKIVRLALMTSLATGVLAFFHPALSITQVDPKKDPAKANELDAAYMGVVTKYEAKDKGALIKITLVNKDMKGYPEYKNTEVYAHPSIIGQIHGSPLKIGDYVKFQMLSPQVLPNYYSPLKKDEDGNIDPKIGNRIIVGVPQIVLEPQKVTLPAPKGQKVTKPGSQMAPAA